MEHDPDVLTFRFFPVFISLMSCFVFDELENCFFEQ